MEGLNPTGYCLVAKRIVAAAPFPPVERPLVEASARPGARPLSLVSFALQPCFAA